MTWTAQDVGYFIDGYLTCALWASTDDEVPLDDDYTTRDIAPDALHAMADDCLSFMAANEVDLTWYCIAIEPRGFAPLEIAGHDLWLTRNRHGAGYWDRGAGNAGDALTRAAHAMGETYLYVGDDGAVYA